MSQEPYHSARIVFCIMDNGSSHHGDTSEARLINRWKNLFPVHMAIHAIWLNQVGIFFSVVQRKVLTPGDFKSLSGLETRILKFQEHYEIVANPFEWKFTREDLNKLVVKLTVQPELCAAA